MTLIEFVKSQDAVSVSKVIGPNGAFISYTKADGSKHTLPVGKRSQNGTIAEYRILVAEDTKQEIATVNEYDAVETLTL